MGIEIYKLKDVDPDNIEDVLVKIQRSFNIKLDNEGLKNVNTFGNLCDLIAQKIDHDHVEGFTVQQAFYKLRNAIANTANIDKCEVQPQTKLSKIFPRESRLGAITELENELGFKINMLQPRRLLIILFIFATAGSIALSFYKWQLGIIGMIFSGTILKLAGKFGKEMRLKTVGDLACKISRESYLRSRHHSCTVNKNEVEQKVRELFINDLHLEPIVLTRKSRF